MSTSTVNGSSKISVENAAVEPVLNRYQEMLGEHNLPASSREFTNLGFSEFVNNPSYFNSWGILMEAIGFQKESWKSAAKFFFAAMRGYSAAKSLALLEEAKRSIQGLAKALGR